jgi:mevalonate kinase
MMSFSNNNTYESQAKLMVSGEYLVLKGARSLALPLKFGQKLTVSVIEGESMLRWKSMIKDKIWFSTSILLPDFRVKESNFAEISAMLCKILLAAKTLNPGFLVSRKEFLATSVMDFDPEWGMGSSSSLISNIAYWADCDPFRLNGLIFNGSGCDVACARSSAPIVYELRDDKPFYRKADFHPSFRHQLYFVYLNRKQNSQRSIQELDRAAIPASDIQTISELAIGLVSAHNIETFQLMMDQHEEIIGKIIHQVPIKALHFNDFNGSVKSLGAWGGDFILAASSASEEYVRNYFINKNLTTIFKYNEIVLA